MNRLRNRQRGMSLVSVLMVAALVVFFGYSGARLAPVYFEYFGVKSSLKSLAGEESVRNAGPAEIRGYLVKRMEINNVKNVKADNISVRSEGNLRIVAVDYEVRTPFYGNLYLLSSFSDQATLGGH